MSKNKYLCSGYLLLCDKNEEKLNNEKGADSFLEIFRPCNHDENYTYVLCGFLQSFQSSGKGLGNSFDANHEEDYQLSLF
mgnify:CR=1 FL=1